jgi:hypothetical protein
MMPMRVRVCLLLALLLTAAPAGTSVHGHQCMYVAGTVGGLAANTIGTLDWSDKEGLIFVARLSAAPDAGKHVELFAWDRVESLIYGENVNTRWTVAISTRFGAPFNTRRRHFLTVAFEDSQGHPGGAMLEFAKNDINSALVIIEARTGRKVQFESADAEAHLHG